MINTRPTLRQLRQQSPLKTYIQDAATLRHRLMLALIALTLVIVMSLFVGAQLVH